VKVLRLQRVTTEL